MSEKGKVAGNTPEIIEMEEGKTYAWCSCGLSDNQPWCNGAHKEGNMSPIIIKCEENKKSAICTCKQTSNPPYCDGAHKNL